MSGRRTLCCKIIFYEKNNKKKGGTTMSEDNIISLENPEENADVLMDLLRAGARDLITKVVQRELTEFLSQYQSVTDNQGRPLVVRNGHLPQREVMTGIGAVDIKVPKTRDQGRQGLHFRSELLPSYIKRTKCVETVLP
jgi:putative transposase